MNYLPVVLICFAWADKLVELKTVCYCGRKANKVLRLAANGKVLSDGAQVEIGGNENMFQCAANIIQRLR